MEHLDFAASGARAGFRLDRVEVYNWGTFDGAVWKLKPHGENALVTGEIGSGKSTLVDAVTTLLVPAQRITYNKAAGAETRERTLRSYVLGYYKAERSAAGHAARPVALRDINSYAVILGTFYNEGFDQRVTLAQVFWYRDPQGQPNRLYIVSRDDLTIEKDFANFGTDVAQLRKRLKTSGVKVYETFPPYGAELRRQMGIDNPQALELFNQTVSMKSVGNLTDFVRDHMLEPFPVQDRVDALIVHFDDLTRAHDAVQKARDQLAMLEPLVADGEQYDLLAEEAASLRLSRDALASWTAHLEAELLDERMAIHDRRLAALQQEIQSLEENQSRAIGERDEIKQAIFENGGDRIERLKLEITRAEKDTVVAKERAELYTKTSQALDFPQPIDAASFESNRAHAATDAEALQDAEAELQNQLTEAAVELRDQKAAHDDVERELESLRRRRSNIPSRMLDVRARLAEAIGVEPDALPFAGELIQVHEDERAWEGVIERVVHNFGRSLLVAEDHYDAVARWVEKTHLGLRLVYFRVRANRATPPRSAEPNALARKLVIKPDTEHYAWLEDELYKRFDHECCDDLARFGRAARAVTMRGQVKDSRDRFEKNDRDRIDDRSRYILGWSNEAKIAVLEQQVETLARRCQDAGLRIASAQNEKNALDGRTRSLDRLMGFLRFSEIDWSASATRVERLKKELAQLEKESDILRTLQKQLAQAELQQRKLEAELKRTNADYARIEERNLRDLKRRQVCRRVAEAATEEHRAQYSELDGLRPAPSEEPFTADDCQALQDEMREGLKGRIDNVDRQVVRIRDRIIRAMKDYENRWPVEAREVDASVQSLDEYRGMLDQIRSDDLPRFEARFKQLLNENTIREVATFQAQLANERQTIVERIATINKSLREIDYNPGRHIALVAEATIESDVRAFQQELRACTEGALTGSGDDQYTEAKFLQVKAIVERFKGRDGLTEADRRWTQKVTDVRQWFVFSASERWHEDETEHEHYSDSGGKSGGQKEKLAYTVLAASLAYQFGLQWGEKRSRSFRFVVIDEAFGRGSDESTRYGLELFERLNLQLLIVTPLQKIHIIEPHVSTVGFVHSVDGSRSMLRNLTIEAYQAEKLARAGGSG